MHFQFLRRGISERIGRFLSSFQTKQHSYTDAKKTSYNLNSFYEHFLSMETGYNFLLKCVALLTLSIGVLFVMLSWFFYSKFGLLDNFFMTGLLIFSQILFLTFLSFVFFQTMKFRMKYLQYALSNVDLVDKRLDRLKLLLEATNISGKMKHRPRLDPVAHSGKWDSKSCQYCGGEMDLLEEHCPHCLEENPILPN